jgi:glutathione S-transferase
MATTTTSKPLTLFGTDLSQPCRSVSWVLRMNNIPFQYEMVIPGSKKGSRSPEHLQRNPSGTVPVIQHGEVILNESNSILVYIAETYGLSSLWPKADDEKSRLSRAKIGRWLHWMHRNSREGTIGLFAPLARPDLKLKPNPGPFKAAMNVLEQTLAKHKFLAETSTPTLADIAVFADVGQLDNLELFDFSTYPHVKRWMNELRKLPGYAETHDETFETLKALFAQAKERAASANNKNNSGASKL